jgi:hypothetical protein
MIAVVAMVAGKVRGVATNDDSPLFAVLFFLLMLVLGAFAVWLLLRLCLAFPASVVEQSTAWNALKRGTMLSRGTRGRILLLYVLGVFLSQILVWCVTFPVLIAISFLPNLQGQAHAQAVGMIAMSATYGAFFAVKALTNPIYGIALTVFYFDQRIRKEGFDIEWMMQQAGMLPPPQSQPEIEPSVSQQEMASPRVFPPTAEPVMETTPTHEPISMHQALSEGVPGNENQ